MFGFEKIDSWELNRKVRLLNGSDDLIEEISRVCRQHNNMLQLVKTLARAINSEHPY